MNVRNKIGLNVMTNKPTQLELINIEEKEKTIRFYYGDVYIDKKYKCKNGKLTLISKLKIIKDTFLKI